MIKIRCLLLGHKWINPDSTLCLFECSRCGWKTWDKKYKWNMFKSKFTRQGWKAMKMEFKNKNITPTAICLLIILGGFSVVLLLMRYVQNNFIGIAFSFIWCLGGIYSILHFEGDRILGDGTTP